jgi:hypothetical protein
VSVDERSVALPKLYGAPAYARPPVAPVSPTPRPFDPDELPLANYQTEEERQYADHLPAHTYVLGTDRDLSKPSGSGSGDGLRPRLFTLRSIAGRLLGGE